LSYNRKYIYFEAQIESFLSKKKSFSALSYSFLIKFYEKIFINYLIDYK
jgi:hypothetical protein